MMVSKVEDLRCPQCRGKRLATFSKKKRRELLCCFSCDLIFVKSGSLQHREDGEKFLSEYLLEEELFGEYFLDKLEFIGRYKRLGLVLDVGCGAGVFLEKAIGYGWKGMGVDPSRPAVGYAKRKGLKVEQTTFEKIKINPTKFDLVTLFQTIEHVDRPVEFIKKAKSLLKNDGMLMLTTPNRESLLGKISGRRWFGYYNDEHLYFYNKKSLIEALEMAGFSKVEVWEEWGRAMTFSWVMTRLADYYYGHRSLARKVMTSFRPFWKYFDFVKFKEPTVNLVAVAWNEKKK